MRSGEEIQQALQAFAKRWRPYQGSERAEAQTFLNELFACYGTDRHDAGAYFEDPRNGGILELFWPGICIIEMKAPREIARLATHREQALRYWRHSDDPAADRPSARYVVLCAFRRFEVWEPGSLYSAPRAVFGLKDLPDRYETLLFLAREGPLFLKARRQLTIEAAGRIIDLSDSLLDRQAAPTEVINNFALQVVWCLFADSLGMLKGRPVQRIIEGIRRDAGRSTAAALGHLFETLNQRETYAKGGFYEHVPYANGGLFLHPARIHLLDDELSLLAGAADFDWRQVDPTIFGSLMEGCLGRRRRRQLGAHYTHEVDIRKIVRPTIVQPWQERLQGMTTIAEAESALADLCAFRVLDPACGCGNFLYVAYQELRRLQRLAHDRIAALYEQAGSTPPSRLPTYPIANVYGIDIETFPAMLARTTLWMGHKLAEDAYGRAEPVLPLVDLSGIQAADALAIEWPKVDAIIGNPPFNGSQHLRHALGDAYVEWLKETFHIGVKDYCVYWFRKAHDHLPPGGRAGLVGTNSVSQNRARGVSLDYIVGNGGVITSAVSSQRWPRDAKVHVSIVNWVKAPAEPPTRFELDDAIVDGITSELRTLGRSSASAKPLAANAARCFQGPTPNGAFVLEKSEADRLLSRSDADYRQVVRPYLIADDIAEDPGQRPRRWIIDFATLPLEGAMRYPAALAIVRERVKPFRDAHSNKGVRERWWRFERPRGEMRNAIAGLDRYLAGTITGKRVLLCWCEPHWCPSNLTNVFALDDDYAFAVLSSGVHTGWARTSTLKGDIRYTPTSVFATFPWPDTLPSDRERIAEFGRQILTMRRSVCLAEQIGLTGLYNQVDDGAYRELVGLHHQLDEAIVAAYGWPAAVARDPDELVARLLERNHEVALGGRAYAPFGGPSPQALQLSG